MIQITQLQLAGLLLGVSVATFALSFILGYWYVRSKLEAMTENVFDMNNIDLEIPEEVENK